MAIKKLLFILLFMLPYSAHAQNADVSSEWVLYKCDCGLFEIRMPHDLKAQKTTSFYVPHDKLYQSTGAQGNYNGITYNVDINQSWGGALSEKEVLNLKDKTYNLYKDYYDKRGGEITKNEIVIDDGIYKHDLLTTYEDPKYGDMYVYTRTVYSGFTIVKLNVIGKNNALTSTQANQFMESLRILPETQSVEENPKVIQVKSKFGLFSHSFLPISGFLSSTSPEFSGSKNREKMTFSVYDSAREEKIKYDVFGYKFGKDLTINNALDVLNAEIIPLIGVSVEDLDLKEAAETENGVNLLEGFAFSSKLADFVRLRAVIKEGILVIQVVVGDKPLVTSKLTDNILNSMSIK